MSTPKKIHLSESKMKEMVSNIINEMLSVSDDVVSETESIVSDILDRLPNFKSEWTTVSNGHQRLNCQMHISIFGETYLLNLEVHSFRYGFYDNSIAYGASVSFDNKIFNLTSCLIDGEMIEETFSDSIQHEVEHIFQRIKKGKTLLTSNKSTFYDICVNNLSSMDCDGFIADLAYIGYLSFECEQDAFANELYSYLKNGGDYGGSPMEDMLVKLLKAINRIETSGNDSGLRRALKIFAPRDANWFIDKGYRAYRRCLKKFQNVIKRLKIEKKLHN